MHYHLINVLLVLAARLTMAVPAALPSEAAGIPSGIVSPDTRDLGSNPDIPSGITNPDTRDVSPNSGIVRKEDIPAGIQIRSLDSVDERGETSANPSAILAGIGGDCNGSGACSSTSSSNCRVAFGVRILITRLGLSQCPYYRTDHEYINPQRYDDKTAYCGYTSRVFGHCAAMFTCSNYNNNCLFGWWLKEQFNKVYSEVLYVWSKSLPCLHITPPYCSTAGHTLLTRGRRKISSCGTCGSAYIPVRLSNIRILIYPTTSWLTLEGLTPIRTVC